MAKSKAVQADLDDKYSDWRVESAYRTLKEAEELKKDNKMMKLVGKLLEKDKKSISSLEELREKLSGKEEDDDEMESDD